MLVSSDSEFSKLYRMNGSLTQGDKSLESEPGALAIMTLAVGPTQGDTHGFSKLSREA